MTNSSQPETVMSTPFYLLRHLTLPLPYPSWTSARNPAPPAHPLPTGPHRRPTHPPYISRAAAPASSIRPRPESFGHRRQRPENRMKRQA